MKCIGTLLINNELLLDLVTNQQQAFIKIELHNDLITALDDVLKELGIPNSIKGYQYLKNAIIKNLNHEVSCANRLYNDLAIMFNTNVANIERLMRHAIDKMMERGNLELMHNIFGYTINPITGKPTNIQFIKKITNYIKRGH